MAAKKSTDVKETTLSPDVLALIEQNKALAEQNSKFAEQYQRALEQINQLTMSVIAGREAAHAGNEHDRTIRVENVVGYTVAFSVTDPRTAQSRHISLPKLKSTAMLCPAEVQEAMEKYPHFFEKGYISAPDYVDDGVNVIRDIQTWAESIALSDIYDTVDKITSLPTLYKIFHWIEDQRYTHLDEQGNPIVGAKDADGRTLYYKLVERKGVDARLLNIEMAVKRRVDALNGAVVNLDK